MSIDDQIEHFSDLSVPILIHHSAGDKSTDPSNSERFADALNATGHPVTLHIYDSANHYFEGDNRQQAADRDVAFFHTLMQ